MNEPLRAADLPCAVCGALGSVVILVGADGERHRVAGVLARPVPSVAFCSLDHARTRGWPFLAGESTGRRSA